MAIYSGFSHEKWWFSIAMLVHQNYQNLFGMVGNLERFGSVDVMVALPFSTRNVLSLPTATDRWVLNKLKDLQIIQWSEFAYFTNTTKLDRMISIWYMFVSQDTDTLGTLIKVVG